MAPEDDERLRSVTSGEPAATDREEERRFHRLYALVLVVLALEIGVFWAITRAFS
jgi:hypothetical protein